MPTPKKPAPGRGPKLQTYARLYVPRTRVRCLGPGGGTRHRTTRREHTFLSEGFGNRVCAACRELIAARCRAYSPTALSPAADAPVQMTD